MSVIASTEASDKGAFQHVLCIWYLVQFQKNYANKVQALINFNSKINMIPLAYRAELGLTTQKTSVKAQKIDGLLLKTYGIAPASFLLQDSLRRVQFFEKTFLLADTSIEVVLEMSFLSLGNIDIKFAELEKLTWRSYTIAEALPTTSWVKLIDKSEFAKAARDKNSKNFVMYISVLEATTIYLSQVAQIAALK